MAVAVALASPTDRVRINDASLVIARRVSSGGAVVLNPLEVAESVLGCLPTVVSHPSPGLSYGVWGGPRVRYI